MGRKAYDDDDGRVIADMSDVSARTPFGYRSAGEKQRSAAEDAQDEKAARPWESNGVSRETRSGVIWGALSAALLIGLAFIVGLGIVIALICWIFG